MEGNFRLRLFAIMIVFASVIAISIAVVTASVGIAIAPQHGEDLETLYKHADKALYASKCRGKNQFYINH